MYKDGLVEARLAGNLPDAAVLEDAVTAYGADTANTIPFCPNDSNAVMCNECTESDDLCTPTYELNPLC